VHKPKRFISQSPDFPITGLPAGTKSALEDMGRRIGKSLEDYLRAMIEVELRSQMPFREILAPIRADFRATGLTEDEFDEIIERERQAIWSEQAVGLAIVEELYGSIKGLDRETLIGVAEDEELCGH
jgi:hypothetical protein